MARPGEDEAIRRYLRPLATDPGAFSLTDDAALLDPPPGEDLVLTKDALVAGVHFFAEDTWDAVAEKALGVNLSDLAAKGARPLAYLLALGLPPDWTEPGLAAFAEGLGRMQARHGIALLGGDTVKAPVLTVSVTAIGAVPAGGMVRRGTARAGDRLYVSGTIGDAALGLALRLDPALADRLGLEEPARAHLLDRYLRPRPRLALAPALRAHARAAMDVSDGLLGDLARMMDASGTKGTVEAAHVPLSAAARAAVDAEPSLLARVLTGGDDYEILAAVPSEFAADFEDAAAGAGVPVAPIGFVEAGHGVVTLARDGTPLAIEPAGYRHF